MLKLTRQDTSIGVFLLVALVAVAGFVVTRAQKTGLFGGAKRFWIVATDGAGVKEQAPVRMNGIDVGIVERIDMDPETRIHVHFRVDPAFAPSIRQDARATIAAPPVLGLTYINIVTPGTQALAEAQTGTEMTFEPAKSLLANVETTVARVESIVQKIDMALDGVNSSLASITKIAKEVAEGAGTATMLLKDADFAASLKKTAANAATIADDVADATGALRRREGAVGRLLADATLVTEAEKLLQKARETLGDLQETVKRLTGSVEKVVAQIDKASEGVEGAKKVIDNTARLSGELADLTTKLNRGQGSVGKLLTDDAVFVEAKALLKELRETIQDLREQAPINSFIGVVFSAF